MRPFVIALLVAAVAANAQTVSTTPATVVPDTTFDLYRGTSKVQGDIAGHQACVDAGKGDSLVRSAGARYTCRSSTPFSTAYAAAPACPPQPADESRQQACPSGTTGTWAQSRSYTAEPAPTCWVVGDWAPATAPSGVCVAPPPPPGGPTLYFSDCQPGAAANCVAGDNSSPGTQSAPKRDLTAVNLNTLPAGATLLFARGGAWNMAGLRFENLNVSAAAPLTLDAYGSGERPLFRRTGATMFQFGGNWGNTSNDGGYVVRNIVADGLDHAANSRGVWLVQNVSDVLFENVAIRRFWAGIESSQGAPHNVVRFALRDSEVSFNSHMGFNGRGQAFTFERNRFEGNNFSGSGFNHAIYLSYGGAHVVKGNSFAGNSTVNGRCTGGNVTFHGVIEGLLVEGNRIEAPAADPGCYGISVTAGHSGTEAFRNVVIRGNRTDNLGLCGICVNSAPGVVIEGNVTRKDSSEAHTGVILPVNSGGDETPSVGAVVRGNTACYPQSAANQRVAQVGVAATVEGNEMIVGAAATQGVCAR